MELIAVMAILAVLSAVLAPSLIDGIDEAYSVAERETLEQLGEDLTRYVRTTGRIPDRNAANWSTAIASVSATPVADVLRNRRGNQRFVYFDPNFLTAGGPAFNGYNQTAGLSAPPNSPRIMLISNIKGNVPNQPANAARFNEIWNQVPGAALEESRDLKIVRLNLSGLFHRVWMANGAPSLAAYSLNDSSQAPVAAATAAADGLAARYVIDGSELKLFAAPFPTGGLASAQIVTGDVSLRYAPNGALFSWGAP